MILPRILTLVLILAVAACGRGDREVSLTRIKKSGDGPDEFTILPGKPLQEPESYARLPAPTPGGVNRTDQTPKADGVAALGGNPAATTSGGIRSGEATLLNHARRYGTSTGIRQTLAAEDEKIRRRHGRVNILNIGRNDDYTNAYRRQWLDPEGELQRLRRRGVLTPTAPPPD